MKLRKSVVHKLQTQKSVHKNLGIHRESVASRDTGGRPAWMHSGTATRVCRPSGKGRFGKRVASSYIEYDRSSNDNSNDSGFECDWNSQSESQFGWNITNSNTHCSNSTEGLQLQNSAAISIPNFAVSSYVEANREARLNKSNIDTNLMKNAGVYLPMKESNENICVENGSQLLLPGLGKTMSPDNNLQSPTMPARGSYSTVTSNSQSSSDGGSSSATSPVPMKKSKLHISSNTPSKAMGLKLRNQNGAQVRGNVGKRLPPGTSPTLTSPLAYNTFDGSMQIVVLNQPEEQHRARYQTEGSRGAIKDRKCNGFPTVQLQGYNKPATLQIFIGSDSGKVSPHMFYQACKVTGKSSTPCIEKKVEGTVIIEIEFEPSKQMIISCDCVGILKERNVDVEQRFPFQHASTTQSRKKSTKCRMVFRTTVVNAMGVEETLQTCSLPILCTQPPGQPEICKQSLTECPSTGAKELFIIGKNFLKDTKIVFHEEGSQGEELWETRVAPLKDYLQQTHLICVVPSYRDGTPITAPVDCRISVLSGGKLSEPHSFTYIPSNAAAPMGLVNTSCISDSPTQPMIQNSINHLTLSPVNVGECQQVVPVETRVSPQTPVVSPEPIVGSSIVSPVSDMEYMNTGSISSVCHLSPSTTLGSPVLANQNSLCSSPGQQTLGDLPSPHDSAMGHISGMSYDSNIMSTSQSQFSDEDELKSLLEQSVVQDQQCQAVAAAIADVKPEGLLAGGSLMDMKPATSFTNLSPNMSSSVVSPMDLQFSAGENALSSIPTTGNFTNINNPFHVESSIMEDISNITPSRRTNSISHINTMVDSNQHQILPMTISSAAVPAAGISSIQNLVRNQTTPINMNMNCLDPIMKIESTPPAPRNPEGQPQPGNNGVVFNSGELQGPIAVALTQMSDNELINYINPSCFDQGAF